MYLAAFAGACVVIAANGLPFVSTLTSTFIDGMFTAVQSFFFLILFGSVQSKIYTISGAANSIADTIMNLLLRDGMSDTKKNIIAMAVILVISAILNLGGIIAGVVIVLLYPVALVIFRTLRHSQEVHTRHPGRRLLYLYAHHAGQPSGNERSRDDGIGHARRCGPYTRPGRRCGRDNSHTRHYEFPHKQVTPPRRALCPCTRTTRSMTVKRKSRGSCSR